MTLQTTRRLPILYHHPPRTNPSTFPHRSGTYPLAPVSIA